MSYLFSYSLLNVIKAFAALFYRFDVQWLSERKLDQHKNVKLMVLLNHTSLYEPLFVRLAPHWLVKKISKHLVAPGADITTNRPIVGKLYTSLLPGLVPISRKRDESWALFLSKIKDNSLVAILPEGRMRRKDGKDKYGKPMTVRGGIADILKRIHSGDILFVYSGGLHHVQIPGQTLPKLFKTIKVNLELVDIEAYKEQLNKVEADNFNGQVIADMQWRLENKTPNCDQQPHSSSQN